MTAADCGTTSNGIFLKKRLSNNNHQTSIDLPDLFTKHAVDLLLTISTLRTHEDLCDVTLIVCGKNIHAHRLILAASSPYFNAMFTSRLRECREKVIELKDLDSDAVDAIVNFMYTTKIELNESNVQNILIGASLFQMENLLEIGCAFMMDRLHPSNCLGIKSFAQRHGCSNLEAAAKKYTKQHFTKVAENEEFLHLSVSELIEIIEADDINVQKESEVYQPVVAWFQMDTSRVQYAAKVFEHIRFPLMSWKFLMNNVVKDNIVTVVPDCQNFYDEARRYHGSQFYPGLHWEVSIRTVPRTSYNNSRNIYVIGGELNRDRSTTNNMELYTPSLDCWCTLTPMKISRRGFGAVTVDDIIYCVGGSNSSVLNVNECFDPQTKTWRTVAPMQACRSSVAVTALMGRVYACGGYDGYSSLSTAEKYDPTSNEWTNIAEMNGPRSMACAVGFAGSIYVIGGYDGVTDLNTVERYTPMQNTWTALAPMSRSRSMLAAVVYNHKIYVAGGCDHSQCLDSVEVYNPSTNLWHAMTPLATPRSGLGLAVVRQHIYAIGGYDGSNNLNSVEKYDEEKNEWTKVKSMEIARRRFACCS
ncbi:kelch-like protein diablo [Anneissia japonica]|uniref:kelch-like protein diablo n=1 Tax=Anneissia japonica TaxID=1529436 RepID=UPI0014255C34|nr:kelch-like protein diablo [Anneissia japonica]XP_033097412.1 kelch-like protein diablo [Anneissia japonica]XP_033097420.1 kelch-like protein diablo [Anneissia japonica]XP_033097429.1 kelch-like protein diablo [Anneissia japonica]